MLMSAHRPLGDLENPSEFIARHIGISAQDETHMLSVIGEASRRALIESIVPRSIARSQAMQLPAPVTEAAALEQLKGIARQNKLYKSFIGQGYHGTHTPGVILRNILENPAWYTAYTPYQAEISQGRMEALVNFQTMVCDLTGMPIANASMLDEATAAAEAMTLAKRSVKAKGNVFIVSGDCHPQTIEVIQTRAAPLGITVKVIRSSDEWQSAIAQDDYFAALNQYPGSSGWLADWQLSADLIHSKQAAFILAADLMALVLLKTPGEMGADIVIGNTQRFGMPMGAGGPHAAYLACRDEFKRSMPGRLVGVSVDAHGQPAYRLADTLAECRAAIVNADDAKAPYGHTRRLITSAPMKGDAKKQAEKEATELRKRVEAFEAEKLSETERLQKQAGALFVRQAAHKAQGHAGAHGAIGLGEAFAHIGQLGHQLAAWNARGHFHFDVADFFTACRTLTAQVLQTCDAALAACAARFNAFANPHFFACQ